MSSAEEDSNDARDAKKRKVQRACDVCRRKKVRCDGGSMPGNRCSNCIAYNLDCTYVEAAKKRGPPKGYVESLENRLEKMESLLNQLCPNADFSKELGAPIDKESWARDRQSEHRHSMSSRSGVSSMTFGSGSGTTPVHKVNVEHLTSDEEDALQIDEVNKKMANLSVGYRFFGKSSGVRLVKTALDFKSEYSGRVVDERDFQRGQRDEFWTVHPWEVLCLDNHEFAGMHHLPPPDLLESLIDLYFEHSNLVYPLLHRPTFDRLRAESLQFSDDSFSSVLLLVCAIGSRWSTDTRVRLDDTTMWSSAGWKYFQQVRMARKSFLVPPSLYDVQIFALGCLFLSGCSAPQVCWTMCGVGIRFAEDVGAHRRKVYSSTPRVEDELWKRAFWVLVVVDRWMSASLGRPCSIQEEDFDLDLPVDVDDEYWENSDPALAFQQPPNKPSKIAYFIASIRLNQIVGFALRTIYSINKSKALLGFVGAEWEQRIVAELDSTLNKWVDGVPGHLRWSPSPEHAPFFVQSAVLYSQYYQLQIMVHRPFIPTAQKPSKLSFPSLAICTNAARAISHIADAARKHFPGRAFPDLQMPSFTAAIVLLLHIWGHRRAGQTSSGMDYTQEMQSVEKCMNVLKDTEKRWHTAGRLWDTIPKQQPSPFMFEPLPMNTDELGRMAAPGQWGGPLFPTQPAASQFDQSLGAVPGSNGLVPGGVGVGVDPAAQNMNVGGLGGPSQMNMFDALLAGMPTGMGADVAMDPMAGTGMNSMNMDMWSNMPTGYGFDDWGSYISNMAGQPQQTPGQEMPGQGQSMPR
ncbi:unnamed protein product [Peniophora sp. CBMAI 1063]|nr:unnamed protein product [Peniophora sp. CBMAI 1063]